MRWVRASEGCGEREVGRKKLESEPKQKEENRGGRGDGGGGGIGSWGRWRMGHYLGKLEGLNDVGLGWKGSESGCIGQ